MKRSFLASAVAAAPLLIAIASQASAATQITSSTSTPVATATAGDVTITAGGSINPTASGAAVTVNSSNSVTNQGAITFKDVSNAVGILVDGGYTGQIIDAGAINVSESYVATTDSVDSLLTGPFAMGTNRTGIELVGPGAFTGSVIIAGPISVMGETSAGVSIQAPLTGDLTMVQVSGTTVLNGSIVLTGDNSVALQITPTGSVGGNVRIGAISARGAGSSAVAIDGAVGGTVNISGAVSSSGYRATTLVTDTTLGTTDPTVLDKYTAAELEQGGPAVSIGANVAGGIIVSIPPSPISTTNTDQDADGVPDASQTAGSITQFGSAPALVIGAVGQSVAIGPVAIPASSYGLVIEGAVTANGLFDVISTPLLPAAAPATAIQIGVPGGGAVAIAGGIHNTGSITATAYQADATGIHLEAGASTPTILNAGTLTASATQTNTGTNGVPINVNGILIDRGASVGSIDNTGNIIGSITGTGGLGGNAGAIIDRSGSVDTVTNIGVISAELNQTLVTAPMPGTLTAIDISASTAPQTITQSLAPGVVGAPVYDATKSYAIGATVTEGTSAYIAIAAAAVGQDPASNPTIFKFVGTTTPMITGGVYFGSGGSTLEVDAGTVTGRINLGAGVNTLNVNGDINTVVTGPVFDEGGQLTLNVNFGTLSDTNPNVIAARSVNVGANGILLVSADPLHGTNTLFQTTGASNFATGAQLGLTLLSLQTDVTHTYTILQTVPGEGTISAGTFGSGILNNAPYLFTATPSVVQAANPATQSSTVELTVARRSAAQLGFNSDESAALNAVLAALPGDANIERSILAQTTEAGLKSVYDQLLPDEGQGLFEALDAAAQAVSKMTGTTPDAGTRVAGTSVWLQEVNERVDRQTQATLGSSAKLLGLVGGYERMGAGGGAIGLTVSYLNSQEQDAAAAIGEHVVASMLEAGAYYRRAIGGLTFSVRGAGGLAWFSGDRRFLDTGATNTALSNWTGVFFDGHAGVGYEAKFGRFYARPELSADYLRLTENARKDAGGGNGFDLDVADRTSTRLSGAGLMTLGYQWGQQGWLRSEFTGGYREIFSGEIGDTVANFSGGSPFTIVPGNDKGGWVTIGFAIKGGTQYSYVALEGDADFRSGETRYDLFVAGRSMF
ncbi:MAG TPA: autotransporter outer membrane beta-barrel domain-containing protein [Caulobacteraceae bacterium]